MNKVKILPEEVISKIAAGEVIERPASVVKELVENSLDAGATSIEINLKDAGKTLIQIRDNGNGIDRADLENIFSRHATSKLKTADDLYAIMSLGFRGEALYSIGAITDVTLQSKTPEEDSGWEIHLRGGKRLKLKPCTFAGHGTQIDIQELFFNTPARKKFLKTDTTEIHQILNTFIPYTILYPECRFVLTHQEKILLSLPATANRIDRIAEVLNIEGKYLLEASQDFQEKKYSFHIVLGDINIKRARRDMQFIFINNRPVQNKSIAYHINQIYRLIMPEEFSPFFAIYINLPAEDIDVNIHPSKREVKIKDENRVCSLLRVMCEQILMTKGQITQATATRSETMANSRGGAATYERTGPSDIFETAYDGSYPTTPRDDYAYPKSNRETQDFFIPKDNFLSQNETNLQKKLEHARFIGAFMNKFLLFESVASLLVIDQHAAAERITYEHLIVQMEKGQLEVQNLLTPTLIKISPQEMVSWEEAKDKLEAVGFSNSKWDKDTIAVHSHPQLLSETEKAVRLLLSGENIARCDFETIARRACRSSIMAGDKLNPQQAEFQREKLLQCLDPFTCPHGRPTIIELSENFLDKQFLRT